jgi:c-di-GMP-related signal transduction protein
MDTLIARQPIFDRQQRVYGYELLFRSGLDNVFDYHDPTEASSMVIANSLLLPGLELLTTSKKAFINVTRDVLIKEYVTLFSREVFVVEILETVESDAEVVAACQKLKNAGYTIALDDFVIDGLAAPLVHLADIIKVDFLATAEEERKAMIHRYAPRGIRLLAEKVETREAFQEALELGYSYFQGYFFSKPVIFSGKDVPAFKFHLLQILAEINRAALDFKHIAEIIKREMSLTYKLLRYINSSFFGLRHQVTSLEHALILLGEREVKKLISLIAVTSMGKDKPNELVVLAIIRAKFCELLASRVGLAARSQDLFLMGMFSLIDAIIDQPLAAILQSMPLADDVKTALLGEDNRLRCVYAYMLTYEKGDWQAVSGWALQLGLNEADAAPLYLEAVEWCHKSFESGFLTPSSLA